MTKTFSLVSLVTLLTVACCSGISAQTIRYVNHAATGANNGQSWTDAFTDLQLALDAAASGDEIWVAKGTYRTKPGVQVGYVIDVSGKKLYGGFNGTEVSASQRNPTTNVTIISADVLGDDIPANMTLNRADNAYHCLSINGSGTQKTIVDGFQFRGGTTILDNNVATDLDKRGAGIIALRPVIVRNCAFYENKAISGGGVACLSANASGSIIDNCVFEANESTIQSAGVFFREMSSGEVNRCVFKNNTAVRGCFYPNLSKGIVIDSCTFEDNKGANDNFGGAMFSWQSSFTLRNCVFQRNESGNGACLYNDHREGGNAYLIENCRFENNKATNYGGTCIYNWVSNGQINNCIFKNNEAANTGPAMYNGGGAKVRANGCLFENGTSQFGAALANYGVGTKGTFTNCQFVNNTASTSGGAITTGFLGETVLEACLFDGNGARWGGAVYCQNDSSGLSVDSCTFNANHADNFGGAVNIAAGLDVHVSRSVFSVNYANYGGAISIAEDSLDLARLTVLNSIFNDNYAFNQAAGINVSNADVYLANCLFYNNLNLGEGAGGAISNNAADGKTTDVTAINCTFAANSAVIGAGIAQWEDAGSTATLKLQNCILQNIGDNTATEDGTPDFVSQGGNLSSDISTAAWFTGTNDLNETDPGFSNPGDFVFTLLTTSPGIDIGVATDAPALDLAGNPRINEPDAGCYENQEVLGAWQVSAVPMQVWPNPAVDVVYFSTGTGRFSGTLMNASGEVVRRCAGEQTLAEGVNRLSVKDLPVGVYYLMLRLGEKVFVGRVVKG